MKIVVIGGTGLVGSQVVQLLKEHGHSAIAAVPATGVNTVTGEGLADVLTGADVVVDVSNSPSFEREAAINFFQTATGNILDAEKTAGVRHHVALSVVGTAELAPASGYFRAKQIQEELIATSDVPYTIVHATQFFEFIKGIVDAATDGDTVRLAPVYFQPIASADVAKAVARAAVAPPANDIVEIAGPQRFRLDELAATTLAARQDPRSVISDPDAQYWGATLAENTLTPGDGATVFDTHLKDWQAQA
ncbi:NmrA family transcriptional regulator [Mycobacterium sp. djl-10]|nr:NmrA family transcriptional regulator [Mycobacterium sp. djl-10]